MPRGQILCTAAVWLIVLQTGQAFYLPGVAPRAFKDGEAVNMKVQTLVSTETPLQVGFVGCVSGITNCMLLRC
jgi:hypothetical protein